MIKVSENSENIIYVNCSRNKTLSNPTYLFSIVNQYTQLTKRFIPQNISFTGNTELEYIRYDKFKFYTSGDTAENFIFSGDTDVNLHLQSGMYYYKIYEQVSTTNLNPQFSHDVVDEGTLYVLSNDEVPSSYNGYSNDSIITYDDNDIEKYHILQEDEYHILTENNEFLRQE